MNKLEKIGLGLSIFIAIACGALFFTWQADRYMEFDSDKWKNKELVRGKDHIRKKMVRSLLKDDRLLGKTSVEITDLLGSSTRAGTPGCNTAYYLGPDGIGWGTMYLCVYFDDRSDRVVATRTVNEW